MSCLNPGSVSTSRRGRNWNAAGSRMAARYASSAGRNPWKYPAERNRSVGITSTRSSVGMGLLSQHEPEDRRDDQRERDDVQPQPDRLVGGAPGQEPPQRVAV